MIKIHTFQHIQVETPAYILNWAGSNGHEITETHLYRQTDFPDPDVWDLLIVMGGPMSVFDEKDYPWLRQEKIYLKTAVEKKKKILGICLGAQLLADTLGAKVASGGQKEIGWFPVTLTAEGEKSNLFDIAEEQFNVLHWHGDRFEIPEGALRLAESEACDNQAFLYKNHVLGLQFHMEVTEQSLSDFVAHFSDELTGGPFIQSGEQILTQGKKHVPDVNRRITHLLNHFTKT